MKFWRRHPVLMSLAVVVFLTVLVYVGTGVAVWRAARNDEARRVDRTEAIAVLGAAQYGGRPSPTLLGRLEHAAAMYRQGFAPLIVTLGGKQPGDLSTEAQAGQSWLVSDGVPPTAVVAEPRGSDTLESIRVLAAFMRSRGLHTVFLVSDPWHNLRIRRMARDQGLQAFVSATWHSAARSQWTRLSGYSRETLAYLYYRLTGR